VLNLEPIKSRIAESTPGDWRWCGESLLAFTPGETHLIVSADVFEVLPGNAALLAESRADLAALVAEVERLRGHVKTADALRLEAAQEHGRERRHWADERHRFAEERIKLISDYWRIREAVVRHRREAQAVNILVEPALADARLWAEVLE
jgi:hypothetical protein